MEYARLGHSGIDVSRICVGGLSREAINREIDLTLGRLGTDHLDMMIIHSLQPWVDVNTSDDRFYEGNIEAYCALEDALSAGKLRAIGVSNFLQGDLQNILGNCSVVPAANQVLCHVGNTPFDLMDFDREHGILTEAYSPVAHGAILNNDAIAEIAQHYGATVPQLCIRYDLQLGCVALPKTANPAHMEANAEIDFKISDDDMETLKAMSCTDYGDASVFPVYGGKMR